MKKTLAKFNEETYLLILHLLRVKLRCKLDERLQRVTVPLEDAGDVAITSIIFYKLVNWYWLVYLVDPY